MSTWRALPGSSGPRVPGRLTGALDHVARSLGAPGASALGVVFGRWPEVVGTDTAAHSRPLRLVGGTLVVGVGDPGRATELRFRANEILDRIEELAGARVAERVEVRVRARR